MRKRKIALLIGLAATAAALAILAKKAVAKISDWLVTRRFESIRGATRC